MARDVQRLRLPSCKLRVRDWLTEFRGAGGQMNQLGEMIAVMVSDWSTKFKGEQPGESDVEIWGYTGAASYRAGESVELHVSTTSPIFHVVVRRDGVDPTIVFERREVPGGVHPTPTRAFEEGCNWPVTLSFETSTDWVSGGYIIELSIDEPGGSVRQDAFFILRESTPAKRSRIALIVPTYTWQAYNDWGGASSYSLDSSTDWAGLDQASIQRSEAGFSARLSHQRPWARGLIQLPTSAPRMLVENVPPLNWAVRYEQGEWAFANGYSNWSGMAGWARYDGLFAKWAESCGIEIEYLTQCDLDKEGAGALDGYECVLTVGHDEYWTAAGRDVLHKFVEAGGNYVRLAGNILWQIRLEDEGSTQVCYKYVPDSDPLAGSTDLGLRTGLFESQRIGNPPVTTFGANGSRGGYARMGGSSPRGIGGFVVYRNAHWAFEGMDLYYGDVIGSDVPLVAFEVDGVDFTFEHGLPVATGTDGAPAGLEIIAMAPATTFAEDQKVPGSLLLVGDGDLAYMTTELLGSDTDENRAKIRYSAATMTTMPLGEGHVFCGATTEWPYALHVGDEMVVRIVKNVLGHLVTNSPRG